MELILDVSDDLPQGTYLLHTQLIDTREGTCITETVEHLEFISQEIQNRLPAYIHAC